MDSPLETIQLLGYPPAMAMLMAGTERPDVSCASPFWMARTLSWLERFQLTVGETETENAHHRTSLRRWLNWLMIEVLCFNHLQPLLVSSSCSCFNYLKLQLRKGKVPSKPIAKLSEHLAMGHGPRISSPCEMSNGFIGKPAFWKEKMRMMRMMRLRMMRARMMRVRMIMNIIISWFYTHPKHIPKVSPVDDETAVQRSAFGSPKRHVRSPRVRDLPMGVWGSPRMHRPMRLDVI